LDARIVAGGTSVAALVDAVAAASTVTPPPTTSNNITLPAASQLQPVAANCSALRSGNYRFLGLPSLGEGGAVVAVNATSLSIALPGGALQLTANGNCRYRTASWQMLLGYLPLQRDRQGETLARRKEEYRKEEAQRRGLKLAVCSGGRKDAVEKVRPPRGGVG
jgi:hypothetical protein